MEQKETHGEFGAEQEFSQPPPLSGWLLRISILRCGWGDGEGHDEGEKAESPSKHQEPQQSPATAGDSQWWDGQDCAPRAMEGLSLTQKTPSMYQGKVWEAHVLLISSSGRDVCLAPVYRWKKRATEHEDAHFVDKRGSWLLHLDRTWCHPSPCFPGGCCLCL